mmetsp:Transcript_23067/g.80408  ORF Transcript_23067/g.80408 Transcript_23067/m.80408 type:complete len:340 (+) Transcript_23067:582-1601(+)
MRSRKERDSSTGSTSTPSSSCCRNQRERMARRRSCSSSSASMSAATASQSALAIVMLLCTLRLTAAAISATRLPIWLCSADAAPSPSRPRCSPGIHMVFTSMPCCVSRCLASAAAVCAMVFVRSFASVNSSALVRKKCVLSLMPALSRSRTTRIVRWPVAWPCGSMKMSTMSTWRAMCRMISLTSKGYPPPDESASSSPGESIRSTLLKSLARLVLTCTKKRCMTPSYLVRPRKCGLSCSAGSPWIVSLRSPDVQIVKPCVVTAMPVDSSPSSPVYQLTKEDLPALWLPTIMTVILRDGCSSWRRPTSRAMPSMPGTSVPSPNMSLNTPDAFDGLVYRW